jgi:hypothetical protein
VKPLSLDDFAGLVFRYHTNRHYYLFALTGGNKVRLALRLPIERQLRVPEWRELVSVDFRYDALHYHTLKVENDGPLMRAYVDGKLMLQASDNEILKGKAGLTALIPARFQDFRVTTSDRVGHNQSPSVAKYRPDLPGLQYISVNFWRNPGIVTLFDWDGNILAQEGPVHTGSPMLPVNWRGDGQEFCFLSANPVEGGLIDGQLRRVVMSPDDGHPDLAANVLDVTGDARDEIIVWDQNCVWIYTQDRPFNGKRIYAPVRNPDYNESNYRTSVSLPAWKNVEEGTGMPIR